MNNGQDTTLTATIPTHTILTRSPNIEVGCVCALLFHIPGLAEKLGMRSHEQGHVDWQFQSTTEHLSPEARREIVSALTEAGFVHLDVGRGALDHHGMEQGICSLDLIRRKHDFLADHPALKPVIEAVKKNDLSGTKLSDDRYNLREMMNGMEDYCAGDHFKMLEWLRDAFCGIFYNAENIEDERKPLTVNKLFSKEHIINGLRRYCAWVYEGRTDEPWVREFEENCTRAAARVDQQWAEARTAFTQALATPGATLTLEHPMLPAEQPAHPDKKWGAPVKVIFIESDSVKAAMFARAFRDGDQPKDRFDMVVQKSSAGHVQIQGGVFHEHPAGDNPKNKYIVLCRRRLDLSQLAKMLRLAESKKRDWWLKNGEDWGAAGDIYSTNGELVPWYLPDFRSAVYNGTRSSLDTSPTVLTNQQIMAIIKGYLPKCGLLLQKREGESIRRLPQNGFRQD